MGLEKLTIKVETGRDQFTKTIEALFNPNELSITRIVKWTRPPLCKLSWGAFTLDDFQWVVTSLTHRFTLFLANGTPVRATLNCEFKQWRSGDQEARLLNKQSADVPKRRTVRRGDTLSSIAGEEYQ